MTGSDWWPRAGHDMLRQRAELLRRLRVFFHEHDVMEVDTPVLSAAATTEPALHSFTTRYHGPHQPTDGILYLHTSPEFPMKRLLAAGAGSIYQLSKVFRDDEAGRLHNPEFTLLEYYLVDTDHHVLMSNLDALLNTVLGESNKPARCLSYQQAFLDTLAIDPLVAGRQELQACAEQHGIEVVGTISESDAWLELLLDQVVIPALGKGRLFIHSWPVSQAALARVNSDDERVADRFELYVDGIELANGFNELADAGLQRQRFMDENQRRLAAGLPAMPVDENFLAALEHGLPACSGVAVGVDRLLMLFAGCDDIRDVIAFPVDRA